MAADNPRHAEVCIRLDGTQAIIAILHATPEGILFPAPGPLSLKSWDAEILGDALLTALVQSSVLAVDLRGRKAAESPVLKASGEPSPRSFESRFVQIGVTQSTCLTFDGRPAREDHLRLQARVRNDAPPLEVGRLLLRMYEVCRDRKF
jgi:hypothetical protein